MDTYALLQSMKLDLGISSQAYDSRLLSKIRVAMSRITKEGVKLTNCEDDRDLVLMYAEWLWQHRRDGKAMPPMVRYAINNRIFGPKAAGGAS